MARRGEGDRLRHREVRRCDIDVERGAQPPALAAGQVEQHDRGRFQAARPDVQHTRPADADAGDLAVGHGDALWLTRRGDHPQVVAARPVADGDDRAVGGDAVPAHAEHPLRPGELGVHRRQRRGR